MSSPKIRKGFRKPRVQRPREKNLEAGYDSKWEYELHTGPLKDWRIHLDKIQYTIHHTYTPDFVRELDGKKILLEAKGRFWDSAEYSKYIWIAKALPDDYELVFLFANPQAPMPQAKKRKDGTKRSHAEWAEANNFRWYDEANLPDEWVFKNKDDLI
jgi:predicted nuclease of restriction endonuclease-like RecB superfamily